MLLADIRSATAPEQAERLMKEAAGNADDSKHDGYDYRAAALRAERKWGELLGEAQHGGDRRSDQVRTSDLILSRTEISRREQARAIAPRKIPDDMFEAYMADRKGKLASRAGLLQTARYERLLATLHAEHAAGRRPGLDAVQKILGDTSHGRTMQRDWDALDAAGRTPYERPKTRKEQAASPPPKTGKAKSPITGKTSATRERENRAERAKARRSGTDNYGALRTVQLRISELCGALETVDTDLLDYGDDEVSQWRKIDIFDDLLTLAPWVELNIERLRRQIDRAYLLERAAKFRNNTGRSPEEAAIYIAKAEQLEREAYALES